MKLRRIIPFIASTAVLISCGTPAETDIESAVYTLTPEERELCAAQHIDTSIVIQLRDATHTTLKEFVPDSVWVYDEEITVRASELEGIMFSASSSMATAYCEDLGPAFNKQGYTIYVFEQNFGLDNEKDKLAIVNTADKVEILRETGTDGINYDITNDSVISIIRMFDAKYELTLTGAGLDWCQFTIGKESINWQQMAEEVYKVCPDVVDQGTGTIEDLATELQTFRTLYLWWD